MEGQDARDHRTATAERREINRRLRAAFLRGAERQSSRERGRGLTEDELRLIMGRYPGDIGGP
jgi:hypothetical protein